MKTLKLLADISTKIKFIILFILISINLYAQKESYNWHFGDYCGISFIKTSDCQNPPCCIESSIKDGDEGCATMSDKDGNVLFYSNGMKVWNKNNKIMTNGDSINSHWSALNAAYIVPNPCDPLKYYLFTTDAIGFGNLYYSEIDYNSDPLGEVVTKTKNTLLCTNVSERLAAIKHPNGTDYWLLAHEENSNNFIIYQISNSGISQKTQSIGLTQTDTRMYVGQMKFTLDGKYFAMILESPGITEYYNWDNYNGELNLIRTYNDGTNLYGLEFSPDGSKLYIANVQESSYILQYDLNDPKDVNGHKVATAGNNIAYGQLQVGPDATIYIARKGIEYIDRIEKPNLSYTKCKYVENFLILQKYNKNAVCRYGLPSFVPSLFYRNDCIDAFNPRVSIQLSASSLICKGESVILRAIPDSSIYIYQWSNGSNKSSISVNDSGNYKVIVTNKFGCKDSAEVRINFKPDLLIKIDSVISRFGNKQLKILIKGILKNPEKITDLNLRLQISFDASAFFPDTLNKEIVQNIIDSNGFRVLTLECHKEVYTKKDSILFQINGTTLLANYKSNYIRLLNFEDLNNSACIDTISGLLLLDSICNFELRKIQFFTPNKLSIKPNPAKDEVDIIFRGDEVGLHTLNIYNVQGVKIETREWNNSRNGTQNFKINLINYPNGVYSVVLKTPWNVITKSLVVAK